MSTDPALDQLSREELVARARALGARRPEVMTRVELRDEIVRLSESDPAARRRSRGWLGVARDLVASVMDAGLNMPSAAARVRGDARPAEETTGPPPVATLTLAEIYLAQGHAERALSTLEEVLATEPEHVAALALRERILSERASGGARRRAPVSEPVSVIPEPVPAAAPFVASAAEPPAQPSPAASAEPPARPSPLVSPEPSAQPSLVQPSFVASVEAPEATRHPELIPGPPDRDIEPIPPTALAPELVQVAPFAAVPESIPVPDPAPFFGEPAPEPVAAPFFAEPGIMPPPFVAEPEPQPPAPAIAAFEPQPPAPAEDGDEELLSALDHSTPISQPVPTMAAPPALEEAEPVALPAPSRAECALVARGGAVEGIYSLPPGASGVVLRVAWFVPAAEGPTGGQLDVPLDPVRSRVSLPAVESSAHIRGALGTDVAGTFHPLAVAWVYRMDAGHLSVAFSPPGEEPVHLRAELDSLAAG